MRKIVVLSFVSLDGVMQAPGGLDEDPSNDFKYGGWTVPYSLGSTTMTEQMSMPFDLLLGRKTYDIFASYWPERKEGVIATSLNKAKKYVVSVSDIDLRWHGSILIKDDVVANYKRSGDIKTGSFA
jgi:dihydrofolate reductase